MKLFKRLYKKIRLKIFKIRNPVGSKYSIPKEYFSIDIFNNIQWVYYRGSYLPYHIIDYKGHINYIPYISTERIKNGNTIINKFLITNN